MRSNTTIDWIGVKHSFGMGHESGTKSRQTLITKSSLKRSRLVNETIRDKLNRREGNSLDHQQVYVCVYIYIYDDDDDIEPSWDLI